MDAGFTAPDDQEDVRHVSKFERGPEAGPESEAKLIKKIMRRLARMGAPSGDLEERYAKALSVLQPPSGLDLDKVDYARADEETRRAVDEVRYEAERLGEIMMDLDLEGVDVEEIDFTPALFCKDDRDRIDAAVTLVELHRETRRQGNKR